MLSVSLSPVQIICLGGEVDLGLHFGFRPKPQGELSLSPEPCVWAWGTHVLFCFGLAVWLPWNLGEEGVGLGRAGHRLGEHPRGPQTSPRPLKMVWSGEGTSTLRSCTLSKSFLRLPRTETRLDVHCGHTFF